MRRSYWLVILALVLVGVAYRFVQPSSAAPPKPDPAPAVTLLDGKKVTVEQFKGKPLVLNFWATWCPPCRMEVPELQKAYKEHQKRVQFLAVALDEPGAVKRFVRDRKITFPVAVDERGELARPYRVSGIPTTFFIGSDGKVAARQVGAMEYDEFAAAIKKLK